MNTFLWEQIALVPDLSLYDSSSFFLVSLSDCFETMFACLSFFYLIICENKIKVIKQSLNQKHFWHSAEH